MRLEKRMGRLPKTEDSYLGGAISQFYFSGVEQSRGLFLSRTNSM